MSHTHEQIETKLRTIVAGQLHVEPDTLTPEATLTSMGADSLDIVELIMHVEDEFNIEITDTEAEKMHTLADVIEYVAKNQPRS
jgi:acyl carrier protein